jgi:hypothetical protein
MEYLPLLQSRLFMVAVAVLVIVLGIAVAVAKAMLGGGKKRAIEAWGKAAYSIWTGGEDSGTWTEQRAVESLSNWYGAGSWGQVSEVVDGLKKGQTGNAAWDLVRAIDILRIAFAAKYLDDEDCWKYITELGRTLQKLYPNWEALAQAFEAGMNAWQNRRGVSDPMELGRVQRNLPALRSSIWPRAAYDTSLILPD